MIVTVLYPAQDGARFDFDYYKRVHAPMVEEIWKPQSAEILKGVAGAGGGAPPYLLTGSFRFASPEALQAAMSNPPGGRADGGRGQVHRHHAAGAGLRRPLTPHPRP